MKSIGTANNGEVNSPKNQMMRWAQCRHSEIVNCSEHFDQDTNQYERFTGIEYGEICDDLIEFIKAASVEQVKGNERTKHVNMCLGLFQADGQSDRINILFETCLTKDGEKPYSYSYYGPDDASESWSTERKPVKYISQSTPESTMGLDPMVKEHLCTAWCFTPALEVHKLFMAQMSVHGYEQMDMKKPMSRNMSRGLKFAINGRNLDVMADLLTSPSPSLSIRFGVNSSDIYYSDVTFSPVIEISTVPVLDKAASIPNSTGYEIEWENESKKLLRICLEIGAKKLEYLIDLKNYTSSAGIYLYDINIYNLKYKLRIDTTKVTKAATSVHSPLLISSENASLLSLEGVREITDLDFVHACPPLCDPPQTGGGGGL